MTIKIGNTVFEVEDPAHIQPVAADIFTECRVINNVVVLSFAAVIQDGEAKPVARITSRLRLTLAGVLNLRDALQDILKNEMPGKEKAN